MWIISVTPARIWWQLTHDVHLSVEAVKQALAFDIRLFSLGSERNTI